MSVKNITFSYSSPEEQGLSSKAIQNFILKLEENQINMHSFILIKNNHIISEGYYAPFKKDTPHRMFSITKSFVSLAIGFLVDKGILKLTDKIINYFPEKCPQNIHPYLKELTIENMLKMATPHTRTTFNELSDYDWTKTFFTTEPSHKQGTVFNYDTSSSHTLTALVEKLTKKKLLDYLRECFLDEIGFSKEAYILSDPSGVSMGGSGLIASIEDLAKLSLVIINNGFFNGKQLIPKQYLKEATSFKISTALNGYTMEEKQGYGYQFWRTRNNGFVCYGLAGQLMLFLPDKKTVLLTTADTQNLREGTQKIYDLFWTEIYDNLKDNPLEADLKSQNNLNKTLKNLKVLCLKNLYLKNNGFNKQKYILKENKLNMEFLEIELQGSKGSVLFKNSCGINKIQFGIEYNEEGFFDETNQKYIACGAWQSENSLLIRCSIIDFDVYSIYFNITFTKNNIFLFVKKIGGRKDLNYDGYAEGFIE